MGTSLKDFLGQPIHVGSKVIHITVSGSYPSMRVKEVTKIDGDKVYLANSKTPVVVIERLICIDKLRPDAKEV
jgi:hypothetical protein